MIEIQTLSESIVLPDMSDMDEVKFHRYLSKLLGYELAQLTRIAYMPKFVKYWEDLKKYSGISDEKRLMFKSKLEKKYRSMSIFSDKYSQLFVITLIYFSTRKKYDMCKIIIQLLAVKFYMNLVHKHFPKGIFEPSLWSIAIDRLSPRHLFKVKNGIPGALMYLASETYKKFMPKIMNKSPSRIKDFDVCNMVYSLRHRIAQSVRAFADQYHTTFQRQKITVGSDEDGRRDIDIISSKLSEAICTYKAVDKGALVKSIDATGLRKDLALSILSQISSVENREDIKYIIMRLHKLYPLNNICKGESERNRLIRKVISESGNEEIVKELIKKLLYSLKLGSKLKSIYPEQLTLFFVQYLTIFIRNRICV